MAQQPPVSPDSRKKKPALPSLLSNLRNAQAAIVGGVTAGHEGRPLIGSSVTNPSKGGSSYAADRSNMKRSVAAAATSGNTRNPSVIDPSPSTRINTNSLSSTLTSLSLRLESSWRKRNQHLHKEDDSVRHNNRRRRPIRLSIPQSFLLSSVCFFVGVPLLVLLYVLARKSVFGDEGAGEVGGISDHKYEVKAFDINGGLKEQRPLESAELGPLKDLEEIDTSSGAVNVMGSESLGVDPMNETSDNNNGTEYKTREGTLEGASLQHSDHSQDNRGNLRGSQTSNIDEDDNMQSTDFETELKLHSNPNNTNLSEGIVAVPEQSTNILDNSVNDKGKDVELIGGVQSPPGNTNNGKEEESV